MKKKNKSLTTWADNYNRVQIPILIVTLSGRELFANEYFQSISSASQEVFKSEIKSKLKVSKAKSQQVEFEIEDQTWQVLLQKYTDADSPYFLCQCVERVHIQSNATLLHLDKMNTIALLAGSVAHELNNPIGSIMTYTQMLLQGQPKNSPMVKDMKIILSAAEKCHLINKSLLDYVRKNDQPEKRVIDSNRVITECVDWVKLLNNKKDEIKIHTNLYKRPLPLLGHQSELFQVILNCINNSIHAVGDAGEIFINTKFKDGSQKEIEISIEDNGQGMTPSEVDHAFEPFFTTKDAEQGTGLGLYICNKIITEHGGSIRIKSEPGNGSTIFLNLPSQSRRLMSCT